MKNLAPICLFTYNRLETTIETVNALKNNYLSKESHLIVFSDGPKNDGNKKNVLALREYIKTIEGFKSITIYESDKNKGLANSIIGGVTSVFEKYSKIIVLEDDLLTTPNFLNFMNQALDFYEKKSKIQSVNGSSLKIENNDDVYFHARTFPWGWGTWKDRWSEDIFDKEKIVTKIKSDKTLLNRYDKACGNDMKKMLLDSISGNINSWFARWAFNHFIMNTQAVYPALSKITNIGFVNDATHCTGINTYVSNMDQKHKTVFNFIDFKKLDKKVNNQFMKYFTKKYKLIFRLKLLRTFHGRQQLMQEFKSRLLK